MREWRVGAWNLNLYVNVILSLFQLYFTFWQTSEISRMLKIRCLVFRCFVTATRSKRKTVTKQFNVSGGVPLPVLKVTNIAGPNSIFFPFPKPFTHHFSLDSKSTMHTLYVSLLNHRSASLLLTQSPSELSEENKKALWIWWNLVTILKHRCRVKSI